LERGIKMQISTLNYSSLNKELRFDAEYYREEVLDKIQLLKNKKSDRLDNLVKFIVGPFGSTVTTEMYVNNSDFKYIRNKDINDFIIKDDNNAFIPEELYNQLKQFHIKENDLLITVVGTLGKVAIAQEKDSKSIFSCKSTIIRSKGNINPYYLLAYLNSSVGQLFSLRGKRGAIQEGLNLFDLKEIEVYIPSLNFQSIIEKIIKEAFMFNEYAKELYEQANDYLLNEIELAKWETKQQLYFTGSFSEVKKAGRIDAEFFQPTYTQLKQKLKRATNRDGWKLLRIGDLSDKLKYGSSTKLNYVGKGIPFLRIADLTNNKFDLNSVKYISVNEANNEPTVKSGDVLISRSGTLGISIAISDELNNAVFGSYFIRIRPDREIINPKFLALYLNSLLGSKQVEQSNTGAIQTNLTIPVIESILVALPPIEIQKAIVEKIDQSHKFEKLSKSYLDVARNGIEAAIKDDEISAEAWIAEKIRKCKEVY
jgi:restriction endonuclease S subunit